ncbi:hypothetical protein NLO95_08990 [Pseudomonas syringae]|nr:hypothetical protein [Pseudomonas syringae]
MKIKKVQIQAFRAYKSQEDGTFDFTDSRGNASNFVAIYAPNGFGKSSFYDAVEWALTNNIERYIRGNYKNLNLKEAAHAKPGDEPQHILRNNETLPKIKTSVSVVTNTDETVTNTLPKTRSNGRDFRFDRGDTKPGTEGFRDIFLSQDAVDSFIRETKPEDRYKIFMEHFGNNTDKTRQKLHLLNYENNLRIEKIQSDVNNKKTKIIEPLDPTIFDEYNSTAEYFSERREDLVIHADTFTPATPLQISSIITELQSTYSNDAISEKNKLDALDDALQRCPEIIASHQEKPLLQNRLSLLSAGLKEIDLYDSLYGSYQKIESDELHTTQALTLHRKKAEYLASYLETKRSVASKNQELSELRKKETGLSIEIDMARKALTTLQSKLKESNDQLQAWVKYRPTIDGLYTQIENHAAAIKKLQTEEGALKDELTRLEPELLIENQKLHSLNAINYERKQLLRSAQGVIDIDDDLLTDFRHFDAKLDEIDAEKAAHEKAQNDLHQQSSILQDISALGHKYVSENQSSACPLCAHDHATNANLLEAIATNNTLDLAYKAILHRSNELGELSQSISDSLNTVIDRIKFKILLIVNSKTAICDKLRKNIDSIRTRLKAFPSDIAQLSQKLTQANTQTLNLSPDNLKSHTDLRIKELSSEGDTLSTAISNNTTLTQTLEQNEFSIRVAREGVETQISALLNRPEAVELDDYIIAQGWQNNSSITDEFQNHSATLAKNSAELSANKNSAAQELNRRHQEMVEKGSWQKRNEIEEEKNRVESTLNMMSEKIDSFLVDISKLSLDEHIDSLTNIQTSILRARITHISNAEKFDLALQKIKVLEQKFSLLLPYANNASLREEAAQLEKMLAKHQAVKDILSRELEAVNIHLKAQIDGFFFTDLINSIYRKIEPHPTFRSVKFSTSFDENENPKLHILVSDDKQSDIPPTLYFSAAQLNILSLSIFLARAIHAKNDGSDLELIMIDDPIHSMDSINVLATIDLLRNISERFNKQIIISTHDENFYKLLQKKIPTQIYNSKFLSLESYGVVKPDR